MNLPKFKVFTNSKIRVLIDRSTQKMKLIFISGPSGSGKTTLSNQIILKIKNGIVLSTDNYYKTGLISKILAKFVEGYFDKSISFNYKLFRKDFNSILKNGVLTYKRSYDFEKKKIKSILNETKNINFLIVEGIFSREFSRTLLINKNFFFLELRINKNDCLKRVLERDFKERGKAKNKAENDFMKSWQIYYEKFKKKNTSTNINHFIITKETNIDNILKKIEV